MLRRLIAAAILACCLAPAPALASWRDVVKDCDLNGRLTKTYTQKEYKDALARLPTDIDEYSDCRDQIKRARLAASSGKKDDDAGAGGGGGGQGAGPTPDETATAHKEIAAARSNGSRNQRIAGFDVRPGDLAFRDLSSVSKLPTPLVVFGLLLLGAALGAGVHLVRTRVRTGRTGA